MQHTHFVLFAWYRCMYFSSCCSCCVWALRLLFQNFNYYILFFNFFFSRWASILQLRLPLRWTRMKSALSVLVGSLFISLCVCLSVPHADIRWYFDVSFEWLKFMRTLKVCPFQVLVVQHVHHTRKSKMENMWNVNVAKLQQLVTQKNELQISQTNSANEHDKRRQINAWSPQQDQPRSTKCGFLGRTHGLTSLVPKSIRQWV